MTGERSCHNCGNAYPNYLLYDEGPCEFFGNEGEDWENKRVLEEGCMFWTPYKNAGGTNGTHSNSMEM